MQSPAGLGAALAKIVSRTRPGGGASGPRCLRGRVVEAEDGLNSAPLRPSGALQDPKGWTVFEIPSPPLDAFSPSDSFSAVQMGSITTLNPQERRPRLSCAQPVAADLRWTGGSREAATCSLYRRRWPAVARPRSDIVVEVLHLLSPPARPVPVAQAMDAPPGLLVIRRC